MNTYVIVSERVGTPGDVYTPADGINVQALLDGGFITQKTSRQSKTTNEEVTENGH